MPDLPPLPIAPQDLIRFLTLLSLIGLLLAVGLRLEAAAVVRAVRATRLAVVLPLNFIAVPALAWLVARGFDLPPDLAVGMLILAAAPFAPVVPVFTRMARGDLALAAGLTALFPVFSTFLTPLVCAASLQGLADPASLRFRPLAIFGMLFATVTLPLLAGLALRHGWPRAAGLLLRPLEVTSEAVGAMSLAFVTWVEAGAILATGWTSLLAMAAAGELYFLLGFLAGGPGRGARRVIAFGTANRNIALALLVAVDAFAGTGVLAGVVANGLLLIFLGLLHVAWLRFVASPSGARTIG